MAAKRLDIDQIRDALVGQLPVLKEQHGVESLSVFGSFVRRENRPDSDLDILVTFSQAPSLLRFIELENDLSDLLGVRVDLVMRRALRDNVEREILREAVAI